MFIIVGYETTDAYSKYYKSAFVQGGFPSVTGAVSGIAVFTVGEMIWAPRLLELSVMVCTTRVSYA